MTTKLLTSGIASPKLAKGPQEFLTYILYLASGVYDRRLCPAAGDCLKSCLIVHAGRGAIGGPDNNVQKARRRKSDLLFSNPELFRDQLRKEIRAAISKGKKLNKPVAIRLNGGSDLDWVDIYAEFSEVQFWEYTKRPDLAVKLSKLPNVHVTYSHNELTTDRIMGAMLSNGINVAMVFDTKKSKALPQSVGNVPVIDGDLTDLRFLDERGTIVGLRLKSLRKPDLTNNNFVNRSK